MHQLNQATGKKIIIFLQLKEFLFSVMTAILDGVQGCHTKF
jgi:hypothetical protein